MSWLTRVSINVQHRGFTWISLNNGRAQQNWWAKKAKTLGSHSDRAMSQFTKPYQRDAIGLIACGSPLIVHFTVNAYTWLIGKINWKPDSRTQRSFQVLLDRPSDLLRIWDKWRYEILSDRYNGRSALLELLQMNKINDGRNIEDQITVEIQPQSNMDIWYLKRSFVNYFV